MIDFFSTRDKIEALESSLTQLESEARWCALISLAWQLRQRDSVRAQALLEEAERQNADTQYNQSDQSQLGIWYGRLLLVKSELNWLYVKFDDAENTLDAAAEIFEAYDDAIGLGDVNWTRASVCQDRGEKSKRDRCLELAIALYRQGADENRARACIARKLHFHAFTDAEHTEQELLTFFGEDIIYEPVVATWIASARALCASFKGEFERAIKFFTLAEEAARVSGQYRQQLFVALQRADIYASLGVLDKALEGDEALLLLALDTGWPGLIGYAQMQTGNVLRLLGQFERAKAISTDALVTLSPMKTSSHFALNLYYLGEQAISVDDPALALTYFLASEELAILQNHTGMLLGCLRGQADAYIRFNQPLTAHIKITEALRLADDLGHGEELIKVLMVIADFYTKFPLHLPRGMTVKDAVNQQLRRVIEIADSVAGFVLSWEVADEMAKLFAFIQEFELAYNFAAQSAQAREQSRLVEIRDRNMIMRIGQEVEQVKTDSEYHKELAKKEVTRVASLQEANTILETLGTIGPSITAKLDAAEIYPVFFQYVTQLISTKSLFIYLVDDYDSNQLNSVYSMVDACPAQVSDVLCSISLDDTKNVLAHCARECLNIIEQEPVTQFVARQNSDIVQSNMLSPLLIGDSLFGVVVMQSATQNAYGKREESIFKALCSYLVVALANADAYQKVEVARERVDAALKELEIVQQQLREASLTDPLTGLRNRRFIDEILQSDTSAFIKYKNYLLKSKNNRRASSDDEVFGVYLLDLDHFKHVNDTYGHEGGDRVLKQFAKILTSSVREDDVVIRLGGEEFLVVLKKMRISHLHVFAKKLLEKVSSTEFDIGDELMIKKTCSIGYTSYPFNFNQPTVPTFDQIIAFADMGMYYAKNHGRNRAIFVEKGACWDVGVSEISKIMSSLHYGIEHQYTKISDQNTFEN